jgi:hypothetical protein
MGSLDLFRIERPALAKGALGSRVCPSCGDSWPSARALRAHLRASAHAPAEPDKGTPEDVNGKPMKKDNFTPVIPDDEPNADDLGAALEAYVDATNELLDPGATGVEVPKQIKVYAQGVIDFVRDQVQTLTDAEPDNIVKGSIRDGDTRWHGTRRPDDREDVRKSAAQIGNDNWIGFALGAGFSLDPNDPLDGEMIAGLARVMLHKGRTLPRSLREHGWR